MSASSPPSRAATLGSNLTISPTSADDRNMSLASRSSSNSDALSFRDGRMKLNTAALNKLSRQALSKLQETLHAPAKIVKQTSLHSFEDIPRLNIVIQVVGSRGDVQPFVALGRVLQAPPYGHRVRLATHAKFKDFVEENGLEFFNLGGDPEALMTYLIRNPGMLPGKQSRKDGDVSKRRAEIAETLHRCWRSCTEPGNGMEETEEEEVANITAAPMAPGSDDCFVADAIIANPPSYGHIHCAEKLGIPLHLMFTMPWCPTSEISHPMVDINAPELATSLANVASYTVAETLVWAGLGDLFNDFRRSLGLDTINQAWGSVLLNKLDIPWTFCWSPSVLPKPLDWGSSINISGFYFLNLALDFVPSPELQAFLDAGPPPVYIGFGSITLEDPQTTTQLILEAIHKAGVRALVSKGWGGLHCDDPPPEVFMLGNVPHDWLFTKVSAVVHHGGAGSTAIGIKLGKPTIIVPFFGDQPFWGDVVYKAGAGPEPIPFKQLTSVKLAAALREALSPEMQHAAREMGEKVAGENGAAMGAKFFHDALDVDGMRCSLLSDQAAVWKVRGTDLKICPAAASTLVDAGVLSMKKLKPVRFRKWDTRRGPETVLDGILATVAAGAFDMVKSAKSGSRTTRTPRSLSPSRAASIPTSPSGPQTQLLDAAMTTFGSTDVPSIRVGQADGEGRNSIVQYPPPYAPEGESATSSQVYRKPFATLLAPAYKMGAIANTLQEDQNIENAAPVLPVTDQDTTSFLYPVRTSSLESTQSLTNDKPYNNQDSSKTSVLPQSHSAVSLLPPGYTPDEYRASTSASRPASIRSFDSRTSTETSRSRAAGKAAGGVAYNVLDTTLRLPVDLVYNAARGWHNSPRLYGDKMVRPTPEITGLKSGLAAAASGTALSLYDAVTGLVTQPYTGYRDNGAVGLISGVGKAIAGASLKPISAALEAPAYLLKGIHAAVMNKRMNFDKQLLTARRVQGYRAGRELTDVQKESIVEKYRALVAKSEEQ